MKRSSQWGLTAGLTLLLTACASSPPPTAQVALGNSAVADAQAAGAGAAAPAQLNKAQTEMQISNTAMQNGDYDKAQQMAEAGEVDAKLAAATARAAQARQAAAAVGNNNQSMHSELNYGNQ